MSSSSPNPYQPSQAPDLAAPPRAPGRPAVWLWAMFALALGNPLDLWVPFLRSLFEVRPGAVMAGFVGVGTGILGFVWAYVTDRRPLLGSRREGHLLLGCTTAVVAWAAAPFVPADRTWWTIIYAALGASTAIGFAATHGAVVELGRRHLAPARLAVATVAVGPLVVLLGRPLSSVLVERSLGWTAGVGAVLALSVGLAAILSEDSPPPAEPSDEPAPSSLLRSKPFWGALAFIAAARLPGNVQNNSLLIAQRLERFPEPGEAASLLAPFAALVVLACMALLARRLSTGTLLRVALLAQAVGFASWVGLGPTGGGDAFGVPIRSAADACLMAGTTTLVLRAAPRGREALAYALLLGLPTFLGSGLLLPLVIGLGWSATVTAAIAASVVVALAVPLLPRELTAGRDGVAPRNAHGTG